MKESARFLLGFSTLKIDTAHSETQAVCNMSGMCVRSQKVEEDKNEIQIQLSLGLTSVILHLKNPCTPIFLRMNAHTHFFFNSLKDISPLIRMTICQLRQNRYSEQTLIYQHREGVTFSGIHITKKYWIQQTLLDYTIACTNVFFLSFLTNMKVTRS